MIVVDANVGLKWLLPEPGMAEALHVLRSSQKLVAPSIIREEVISALVRRVRREELSSGEARQCALEWLAELGRETVHLIDDQELLVEASELGFQLKHPLYDCLYLALAVRLSASLVTADKPFFERASQIHNTVFWLMDVRKTF